MIGLAVLIAVGALACAFGLWRMRSDGRFSSGSKAAGHRLTADQLGSPLGDRATIVEFSSAFCAPCRATRRVLDKVATDLPGVAVVEIDAEHNLELTRELGVMRTPTVFVLDSAGIVRNRAAGQPRYADVVASLGPVIT